MGRGQARQEVFLEQPGEKVLHERVPVEQFQQVPVFMEQEEAIQVTKAVPQERTQQHKVEQVQQVHMVQEKVVQVPKVMSGENQCHKQSEGW